MKDPAKGLVRVRYTYNWGHHKVCEYRIEVRVGPIWVWHTSASGGEDWHDLRADARRQVKKLRDRIRRAAALAKRRKK